MEISKEKKGETMVVAINGRLDTTNYADLDKELNELLDAGENNLLMDCSEMNYISSSGLRVFLVYLKKLKASGGKMQLCGLQEMIKEIFLISGFSSLFTIYETCDDALK